MLDIRTLQKGVQPDLKEFAVETDLSYITLWGNKPFTQPVFVEGQLKQNSDNTYNLAYTASTSAVFPCGRCLSEKEYTLSVACSYLLKENVDDDFDGSYYPIEKEKINLDEMVGADLILEAEHYALCKPDCRGLCPKCGVDLNAKKCSCNHDENLDPRFDILRDILNSESPD